MTYFSKLRNLRTQMEIIERQLQEMALQEGESLETVVDDFNNIYHEFTSQYHEQNRLSLVVTG